MIDDPDPNESPPNLGGGDATALQQYQVDLWVKWADQLRAKVDEAIVLYRVQKRRNASYQRVTGIALLLSSVLAPIFTASSGGLPGIDPDVSRGIAVVLSAIVAILVGLRRIFRFELLARTSALAVRDLQEARERFRDADGTLAFASPAWIEAYRTYRDRYFEVARRETINFNTTLADPSGEGRATGTPDAV